MRAHPEAARNRLELLGFLVNAPTLPPEPRLMHERSVRRVHQSNNPVIDVRRQLAGKVRDFVFVAEYRKRRRRRNRLRKPRPRAIHVHPNVAVTFFARIVPRKNPLHFQLVLSRQRRNLHALPAASIESPSVVAALHHFPVKPPIRQRYPPVRTRIPHRKRLSFGGSAKHQRHFQQHRCNELLPANLRTPQRRIPEIPQKSSIRLRRSFLRRIGIHPHHRSHRFAHRRRRIVVYRSQRSNHREVRELSEP